MYAGAFFGFAVAYQTGDPWIGLLGAIVVGLIAGALMALMTVTLGANQHVSGLGLTIVLIGLSEFANRMIFTGGSLPRIEPMPLWDPLADLAGPLGTMANQYGLTYVAFFLVVPISWWVLMKTPLGLSIRAVGENPEAADVAGINVFRVRYIALMIGGALMAVGGAFITLSVLGTFTLDIIAGRGWVVIALVIFGRWRIFRGVFGAPHLRGRLLAWPAPAHHPRLRGHPQRGHAGAALPHRHPRPGAVRAQRALPGRLPQAVSSVLDTDHRREPWTTTTS